MNKTYTVFHAKEPTFGIGGDPAFNMENYIEVAKVQCDTLDAVYSLTNHIKEDWTLNKEILFCNARVRSTSCGDVIVDDETGIQYKVLLVGFGNLTYIEDETPLKRFGNGWMFKAFRE